MLKSTKRIRRELTEIIKQEQLIIFRSISTTHMVQTN